MAKTDGRQSDTHRHLSGMQFAATVALHNFGAIWITNIYLTESKCSRNISFLASPLLLIWLS
jgi:hypothetical protein